MQHIVEYCNKQKKEPNKPEEKDMSKVSVLFFSPFSEWSHIIVQGPVFSLEDGKSAISLNDALMWAKVNPFSPLGTGLRINPF